ncbi:MAG TPA: response regulator [Vicinamibacterales bacterium]|nr:response regulator [Vicinamibacterales bacterium]
MWHLLASCAVDSSVRRVVVADDNMLMANGLKLLLEMWGFDVTLAHDGLAAVAAIRDVQPRAALVDLLMPRLDGLEVARRVRADARARAVFLVAMTGLAGPSDRSLIDSSGFDAHLVKPIDTQALRALLPAG